MARRRCNHPCRGTDRLGELTGLHNLAQWETAALLKSEGPEHIDQKGPLPHPYSGGNHPPACWQYQIHEVGWNFIILMYCPRLRVFTPHNVQHTMGTEPICALTIQTHLLPRHLQTDDGPAPHPLRRSHRNH